MVPEFVISDWEWKTWNYACGATGRASKWSLIVTSYCTSDSLQSSMKWYPTVAIWGHDYLCFVLIQWKNHKHSSNSFLVGYQKSNANSFQRHNTCVYLEVPPWHILDLSVDAPSLHESTMYQSSMKASCILSPPKQLRLTSALTTTDTIKHQWFFDAKMPYKRTGYKEAQ